jgi:CHAT domain-containing protein/tetratricopeptide (TPR) repeat protein
MRANSAGPILLLILSATVSAAQTPQPNDPLELQKRAVARIDSVIDRFRRTGDTRLQVSELVQAGAELSASNRALAARQNWSALAFGLIKEGHVHRLQGQWAEAIALYQSAQEAATRGRDVVRQSDALAWRALAESSRRNLGPAVSIATQAVHLAETTSDKDILARALDVLGSAQIAQLNLVGAGETTNREVVVAEQATDPTAAYFAYLNRYDVYRKLGEQCDYNTSFDACNQAYDRAKADLEKAVSIVRRLGYAGLVQQTDGMLRNLADRRALSQVQQSHSRAVTNTAIFQPKKAGDVLVTERFASGPQQVTPELLATVQSQKQLQQQLGRIVPVNESRDAFTDGVLAEMQGNNDLALGHYLKSIDALERDRRSLRDEAGRGTFAADRINFYYAAVLQLLDRRRFADAFVTFERARSRALADLLASRKLALARPEEQRLYADSALIRSQIADAQSKLLELASEPDASKNATRLTSLNGQIRALEEHYRQASSRIATEAPRLQNLVDAKPANLKALQDAMRAERFELIQYLVQESGVVVWHIGPDSITVRNVFLPRPQVIAKVASLQKSLSDRNAKFDETTARELFLYLIQPVLAQIRSDRLVIVPHEDLNYVPFQAFQDPADGRYLGERFQISYAPSASVLLGFKRSSTLAGGRLFAAADPSIVAAVGEVASIGKLFPGRSRVISNNLALESEVKTVVRDYDIVHLSVHGKFNAAEPMLSYVALAAGASDDGRLTAAEMFGLPLDNSRLVVLSACDTGRAEATHANEVIGLVRALIYAGAGALVLSYWEVDSDATALWMRTFYEAALTRPIAEAARVALTRVKSDPAYSHPYYWAAFAMVGR